jgi:hypothetical protein
MAPQAEMTDPVRRHRHAVSVPSTATILEVTETGGLLFLAESREEALEALPPPRA